MMAGGTSPRDSQYFKVLGSLDDIQRLHAYVTSCTISFLLSVYSG